MNNIEMQYEFTKLIQEMDSSFESVARPTSETIFRMINYAINRYIKEKYLSGPSMKENIQEIQYRADDLRNLINIDEPISLRGLTSTYAEKKDITLPDDYMFYIRSDSKIYRNTAVDGTPMPPAGSSDYEWTPNRVANYDELDKIVTSPTNKPILRKPVILFNSGNKATLYHDRYTVIDDFALTYLRNPKELVLTITDQDTQIEECELAIHTHEEIVKLAVTMYIDQYKTHLTQAK